MKWLTEKDINDFLNKNHYDIRKTFIPTRWMDQKCTPDVLTVIADFILEYCNTTGNNSFTSYDVWHNEYTAKNVEVIYKKPNPKEEKAKNEYDKFFQQPMELLAYARILKKSKDVRKNLYTINEKGLLEYISISEMNSLTFLNLYITKVLKDSEIYYLFDNFFNNPNKDNFEKMKKGFGRYIVFNTPIQTIVECNRIFTKVLNPMAFFKNTSGAVRGYMSKYKVTKDMLMYNRDNFRDIYSNKPKDVTRKEHNSTKVLEINENYIYYQMEKAKKILRLYNDQFRNGKSEVVTNFDSNENATHIHHIFPDSEFKEISYFIENLIALTPTQHLNYAHENGNTRTINKSFQQICLMSKVGSIEENLKNSDNVIYSFEKFSYVLSVGLNETEFLQIEDMNFVELVRLISNSYIKSN
ncbi:MAG: restriction endonuclease [Bacilli bacterium]|nr:restriction endonuclease [Bacilli bacterium]MDD4795871.1 restriction endonuclease [Bacilli bacterium]